MAQIIDDPIFHNQLFTNTPLSPDGDRSRYWKVLVDVDVAMVVKSPIKSHDDQRYLKGKTAKTNIEWIFSEKAAHRIEVMQQFLPFITSGFFPVFVETPEVGMVSGNEVVGFIISGDCITLYDKTDDSEGEWLKRPVPKVVSTTTSAKKRLKEFQVQNSKKNGFYDVVVYTDKTVSCPCKAWINRRDCRHIRDAQVVSFIQTL